MRALRPVERQASGAGASAVARGGRGGEAGREAGPCGSRPAVGPFSPPRPHPGPARTSPPRPLGAPPAGEDAPVRPTGQPPDDITQLHQGAGRHDLLDAPPHRSRRRPATGRTGPPRRRAPCTSSRVGPRTARRTSTPRRNATEGRGGTGDLRPGAPPRPPAAEPTNRPEPAEPARARPEDGASHAVRAAADPPAAAGRTEEPRVPSDRTRPTATHAPSTSSNPAASGKPLPPSDRRNRAEPRRRRHPNRPGTGRRPTTDTQTWRWSRTGTEGPIHQDRQHTQRHRRVLPRAAGRDVRPDHRNRKTADGCRYGPSSSTPTATLGPRGSSPNCPPTRTGVLVPGTVDRLLISGHTELQRPSEELRTGQRLVPLDRPAPHRDPGRRPHRPLPPGRHRLLAGPPDGRPAATDALGPTPSRSEPTPTPTGRRGPPGPHRTARPPPRPRQRLHPARGRHRVRRHRRAAQLP